MTPEWKAAFLCAALVVFVLVAWFRKVPWWVNTPAGLAFAISPFVWEAVAAAAD